MAEAKNKGGRPLKTTVQALNQGIDRYFAEHNTKGAAPKWHDMLNYLKLSDDTILRYRSNRDSKYEGYAEAIKRAERLHSCFWQQLAIDNPNLQAYCIFQLKQPHNGGLIDKPQQEVQKLDIEVKIKGCDDSVLV